MKVFLDDIRNPTEDGFTVVRSYEEFKNLLETTHQCPDFISFDHDLGHPEYPELERTGYHCALLLVEMHMDEKLVIPAWFTFRVHSQNPVGAKKITWLLTDVMKHFYPEKMSNNVY